MPKKDVVICEFSVDSFFLGVQTKVKVFMREILHLVKLDLRSST